MAEEAPVRSVPGTRFTDVRRFDELGSTNAWLLDQARSGAPDGLAVVAAHQTAGRGRLGRTWSAPPGASLLLSVLVRPAPELVEAGRLHLLTAATALSASDACLKVAGFRPRLKWPNDLVVDGALLGVDGDRKLAGILAEAVVEGGAVRAVVVGIGVNVTWPRELPEELRDIAVAANHVVGRKVPREALLAHLLVRLDERLVALEAGPDGWDQVAAEHRSRCATLGRRVRVELPDGELVGVAVDVDGAGHLVVEEGGPGGGRREISAADVVHLRPAP